MNTIYAEYNICNLSFTTNEPAAYVVLYPRTMSQADTLACQFGECRESQMRAFD